MPSADVFVLDSSVCIEAAKRYYAFDLAPKFWESLIEHSQSGQVLSIDRVKNEIAAGHDTLAKWVEGDFSTAFLSSDEDEINSIYAEIMGWVYHQDQYFDYAKTAFASAADGWLIAYAKAKNCIVATEEVLNATIKRKVPIPNVCKAFDVDWVNTFDMLRTLGVKL